MRCQNTELKQHRKTTLSLRAPSQGFKGEAQHGMKGWMQRGIGKTLASPRLNDVEVYGSSSLKVDTIRLNEVPSNVTYEQAVTQKVQHGL